MRIRVVLLFLLLASLSMVPAIAAAKIPNFGPIIPDIAYNANACPWGLGWGAVILVINNIVEFMLTIIIVGIAPVMIAYTGFQYVVNSVNPSGLAKAKAMLWNIVVGLIVALSGWLIVDLLMAVLYNSTTPVSDRTILKTWNTIISSGTEGLCLKGGTLPGTTTGTQPSSITSGGPASAPYGGTCTVQTSGPCSIDNMSIFGAVADQASMVCYAESGSSPHKFGDLTKDGSYVSLGLFQINMTVHKIGGLNCPSAFSGAYTGSNKNVTVTNPTLYNQCVAAALDPTKNIAAAKSIYSSSGSWKPWSVAKKCNLAAGSGSNQLAHE
jgi:hypothetical protein